jgi:hypothetical protein
MDGGIRCLRVPLDRHPEPGYCRVVFRSEGANLGVQFLKIQMVKGKRHFKIGHMASIEQHRGK